MEAEVRNFLSSRETRRESRRDKILDVAEAQFMKFGYAGTAMSNIVNELGGSKGTLWSYFPSKYSLFTAVVDRASSIFRDTLKTSLDTGEDIETVLLDFCRKYIKKITLEKSLELYRLIIGESIRFPEIGTICPSSKHLAQRAWRYN